MAQGKRVTAELGVLIKANNKLSGQVQKARRDVSGFKQQLKGLGSVIAGAFAIGAVVNFGKAAVRAFDIQAKAQASLLVALKGNVNAQQELIAQAKILQKTTLFGDEATIQAAAMLASMGLQAQEIKKLIPLVQDFATLQKLDLSTAANLVAKSVGSSTNALTRYGIQIEGAVGSSERLESAVKAMNEKVGGQAAAAAKVGAGELQQLSNLWEDFTETIGFVIAKGLIPLAAHLKEVVSDLDLMLSLLSGQQTLDQTETQLANLNKELNKTTEELIRAVTTDPGSLGFFMFNPNNPATIGTLRREIKKLKDDILELTGEVQKAKPLPDFFGLLAAAKPVKLGDPLPKPKKITLGFSLKSLEDIEIAKREQTALNVLLEESGNKLSSLKITSEDTMSAFSSSIEATRQAFIDLDGDVDSFINQQSEAAEAIDTTTSAVGRLAEAQETAAALAIAANLGQAKSLEDFGRIAVTVARQIISAEIAKGVAGVIRGALLDSGLPPPFSIILAGIAAGAAVALFNAAIPSFAGGVQNFSGGLAVVGERGPELLDLPRGTDVIPNNKIGGFGGNLTIVVEGNLIGTEHELGRVVTNALARFKQNTG